jgi:hypothetical protein
MRWLLCLWWLCRLEVGWKVGLRGVVWRAWYCRVVVGVLCLSNVVGGALLVLRKQTS